MKERIKYREAIHFYEQMKVHKKDQDTFKHNLSAFLTSSRTVFQYALKESHHSLQGKIWYDRNVSSSPIIRFLKDKRDDNIHTEPVDPQSILSLTFNLNIKTGVTFTKIDKDGKVVSQPLIEKSPELKPQNRSSSDVIYRFKEWTGPEDIITLCGLYLVEIDGFISDGVAKNFISG